MRQREKKSGKDREGKCERTEGKKKKNKKEKEQKRSHNHQPPTNQPTKPTKIR